MSTHENAAARSPRFGSRRRWPALGVLSLAALLLHTVALSGLEGMSVRPERPAARADAVQVRWVEPAGVAPAEVALIETAPMVAAAAEVSAVPGPSAVPAPAPVQPPVKRTRVAAAPLAAPVSAESSRAAARAEPVAVVAAVPSAGAVAQPALAVEAMADVAVAQYAAPPAPAATPGAGADEPVIPHYRTRLPPPLTLRYEMQRGGLRGTGDLVWRPEADRYELRLDARVSGLAVLTQVSSGLLGAAGLAPERFTDKRLGRGTTAANFQRAAGKITYSGPSTEVPLHPGAQDRLSWMVQLSAIVAAEPQLARPGAHVLMQVTGTHADAGVWSFRCVGPESVSLRGGMVDAIKFVREPREAYDTTVQVWLAPQQHDLPVRATQKSGPSDEGYELRLIELVPGP